LKDIAELIGEVKNNYRPWYDYSNSSFDSKDLIVTLITCQWWTTQTVAKILLLHDCPLAQSFKVALSFRSHDQALSRLYTIHPDTRPIQALVWWRCSIADVTQEMKRRTDPLGQEAILLELNKVRGLENLSKLLKVERIESVRRLKYGAEDLQSLAYENFWRYRQQLSASKRITLLLDKPPPFPPDLGLSTADLFPEHYSSVLRSALEPLSPIIGGDLKEARGIVRQKLRDFFKQWKAQMRTGEEVEIHESDKQLRLKSFRDWIERGVPSIDRLGSPDISAKMFEVLKEAKRNKRWGDKAVKAFKYYLEGKTEKEASKLAGIDSRTFRNYILRLQKIFARKK
jgi:hypothetical protein